ncbi:hypothetical protein [Saccharibacillus kuerlensis]|uniref:Uncharacterized protein n=1 Tax=Saccharibacillus kuerlensis TaxID=459527 RepID=A0ABQ2KRH8_9BACL|nr:hypothetical protein [Saccharibacillus kuerlensis]GGN91121.1 hypothetical protein GCM10010969_02390 [Saccharibacillus kuerlensis]
MRKTLIGCVLTLVGAWMIGCIFIAAAIFVPNMSTWEGTRIWYAIFGDGPYEADLQQSMALGLPFAVGILILVIGLLILAVEYFRTERVGAGMSAPTQSPADGEETKRTLLTVDKPLAAGAEDIPTMKEVRS